LLESLLSCCEAEALANLRPVSPDPGIDEHIAISCPFKGSKRTGAVPYPRRLLLTAAHGGAYTFVAARWQCCGRLRSELGEGGQSCAPRLRRPWIPATVRSNSKAMERLHVINCPRCLLGRRVRQLQKKYVEDVERSKLCRLACLVRHAQPPLRADWFDAFEHGLGHSPGYRAELGIREPAMLLAQLRVSGRGAAINERQVGKT